MPIVEPLFKNDKPHFHTNGGGLAVGYKLYTYFAGTNSPVAMYSDPSGTTIYENPIVLNSRGEPDGQGIYADITHTYKIILKDTMDNVVWSMDDVSPMGVGEIHIESGIENIVADTANVNVTISQDGKTAHIGVDDSDAGMLSVFKVTYPSGVKTYPNGDEILAAVEAGKYVVIDEPNLGVWEHTMWLLRRAYQGQVSHLYFQSGDLDLIASYDHDETEPKWEWEVQ